MRWIIVCTLFAGCGDNAKAQFHDAGVDDAPATDAATRLKGCLDTPGLATAPSGQLPCDLVPPGLEL